MKIYAIILSILLILLLAVITGCSNSECPEAQCPDCECPVVECSCPDTGSDFDCSRCPGATVKEVEVIKYVCPDESVEDSKEACFYEADSGFTPITTNEEGSMIEYVTVKPACVNGIKGGSITYKVGSIAQTVEYQFRTKDSAYETYFTENNKFEGNDATFTVEKAKYPQSDFKLEDGKEYLFRMKFYISAYDEYQYSNEYIVDARAGSDYMTKEC